MPADALFRIYSMTKPIVSVAVMQLVERGALLLSDTVSAWLPAFAGAQVAVEHGGEVRFEPVRREATVQDLLRHTAGFTYEFQGDAHVHRRYQQARIASRGRSNAEFCRVLAGLPLAHQPGAVWDYSRATDVAGRLIEVVSGQTLGAYLREHILAPLGMHETGFVAPEGQHHRIAEPFALDPDDGTPVHLYDLRKAAPMESGGGGLMSTLADYARFAALLAAGGTLEGVRILGRASVALMTADHLGALAPASPMLPPGFGFGLGLAVRTHAGLADVPGSVGTYHWNGIGGTFFFVDPTEALVGILLTQAPGRREPNRLMFRNLVYAALRD
jgi:CubicO group peptidase (beta-lactamase class C family)